MQNQKYVLLSKFVWTNFGKTFHLEENVHKESYSGVNCYGLITQL